MTANAIVMKLNALLADPIDSECKVVYLLCEIRKLLHPIPTHARPFALNMYCHWALHVDLHGKDTLNPFLQQLDVFVNGFLVGPEHFAESYRMVRELILLETFRAQLREFLHNSGIRHELTDDDERWAEFVTHYAGVIEDGSLSIRDPNHGLKHVRQVTFLKGRDPVGEFSELPFAMVWRVSLHDGRTFDIDVSARPPRDDVERMIGWGIHVR